MYISMGIEVIMKYYNHEVPIILFASFLLFDVYSSH